MRTIKFRAWNKLNGSFINEPFMIDLEGFFYPQDSEGNYNYNIDCNQVELMQFTGLHDKNGKEIFEGDICRAMQGEQEKPTSFYEIKGKVCFYKGSFEFFGKSLSDVQTDENGNAKRIIWCWHGHFNTPDIYEQIDSIEVIGNIYQNPELLK